MKVEIGIREREKDEFRGCSISYYKVCCVKTRSVLNAFIKIRQFHTVLIL